MKTEQELTRNSTMIARPLLSHASFTPLVYKRILNRKGKLNKEVNWKEENPVFFFIFFDEILPKLKFVEPKYVYFSKTLLLLAMEDLLQNPNQICRSHTQEPKKVFYSSLAEKAESTKENKQIEMGIFRWKPVQFNGRKKPFREWKKPFREWN